MQYYGEEQEIEFNLDVYCKNRGEIEEWQKGTTCYIDYREYHKCQDTTLASVNVNACYTEQDKCAINILTSAGISSPENWKCCLYSDAWQSETACAEKYGAESYSCQDTTAMVDGSNGCEVGYCDNDLLSEVGIQNPGDWKCCPESE